MFVSHHVGDWQQSPYQIMTYVHVPESACLLKHVTHCTFRIGGTCQVASMHFCMNCRTAYSIVDRKVVPAVLCWLFAIVGQTHMHCSACSVSVKLND